MCSKQGRVVLICSTGGLGVMAETCAQSGHTEAASGMILLSAVHSLRFNIPSLSTTNRMGTVKPNTSKHNTVPAHSLTFFFFGGATARGGPWPPLQYASKPLDPLLYLSIRLFPSFSGPCTRHPATSFLVFLFVLLHTAFCTSSLELQCLSFSPYDQAIIFFGI